MNFVNDTSEHYCDKCCVNCIFDRFTSMINGDIMYTVCCRSCRSSTTQCTGQKRAYPQITASDCEMVLELGESPREFKKARMDEPLINTTSNTVSNATANATANATPQATNNIAPNATRHPSLRVRGLPPPRPPSTMPTEIIPIKQTLQAKVAQIDVAVKCLEQTVANIQSDIKSADMPASTANTPRGRGHPTREELRARKPTPVAELDAKRICDEVDKKVARVDTTVYCLERKVNTIQTDVGNLVDQYSRLDSSICARNISDDFRVKSTRSKMRKLENRMNELEDRLTKSETINKMLREFVLRNCLVQQPQMYQAYLGEQTFPVYSEQQTQPSILEEDSMETLWQPVLVDTTPANNTTTVATCSAVVSACTNAPQVAQRVAHDTSADWWDLSIDTDTIYDAAGTDMPPASWLD